MVIADNVTSINNVEVTDTINDSSGSINIENETPTINEADVNLSNDTADIDIDMNQTMLSQNHNLESKSVVCIFGLRLFLRKLRLS